MASVEKYTQAAVYAMLKHNERTASSHSNTDIDPEKSDMNYRLSPDHGCTDYDYFKKHLANYKCMNRADIVKMASWIITAPEDLQPEQEAAFFKCCHEFFKERYGADQELQAIVHYDEMHTFTDVKTGQIKTSRPHLHYSFIPAITDKNGEQHICAKKILTKSDLRNFHADLQRYLDHAGIHATVYSGVTKKNGGNMGVKELKKTPESINRSHSFKERSFTF